MADDKPAGTGRAALLRILYPLPGAATGAAAGFHLYFLRPGLNTDTIAPALFAAGWALCAMLVGALFAGIAGWLMERALRRAVSTSTLVTCGVALLCLTGLCGLAYAPLLSRAPALLWPQRQAEPALSPGSSGPTCAQEPPPGSANRRLWEQECQD
jgi:MFS family permease